TLIRTQTRLEDLEIPVTRDSSHDTTSQAIRHTHPSPWPVRCDDVCNHRVVVDSCAESKNSSQHNQSKKNHRNGIKKPKTHRYPSLKGTDPKFRRNHRHALHGTMRALKEVKEGKRDAA
ncbi:hypothetical protein J1614_001819, partial [Plenodomus biglobosus]